MTILLPAPPSAYMSAALFRSAAGNVVVVVVRCTPVVDAAAAAVRSSRASCRGIFITLSRRCLLYTTHAYYVYKKPQKKKRIRRKTTGYVNCAYNFRLLKYKKKNKKKITVFRHPENCVYI